MNDCLVMFYAFQVEIAPFHSFMLSWNLFSILLNSVWLCTAIPYNLKHLGPDVVIFCPSTKGSCSKSIHVHISFLQINNVNVFFLLSC